MDVALLCDVYVVDEFDDDDDDASRLKIATLLLDGRIEAGRVRGGCGCDAVGAYDGRYR